MPAKLHNDSLARVVCAAHSSASSASTRKDRRSEHACDRKSGECVGRAVQHRSVLILAKASRTHAHTRAHGCLTSCPAHVLFCSDVDSYDVILTTYETLVIPELRCHSTPTRTHPQQRNTFGDVACRSSHTTRADARHLTVLLCPDPPRARSLGTLSVVGYLGVS